MTTTDYDARRLLVILKDSNDAITVLDLRGNIICWNRGAERMYGYSEHEALSMNLADLIPPDLRNKEMEYLKLIASGETVEAFEGQRVTKNGRLLYVWATVTCLKNDSGIIDSVSTTERDITDIKKESERKEKEIEILRGLLPICANCKDIRDDKGYWHRIESYINEHTEATFTHSICPKCAQKLYPELFKDKK